MSVNIANRITANKDGDDDINALVLVKKKENERYVFLYGDGQRAELFRVLGRFAGDPDLSLTWRDAGTCVKQIRKQLLDATDDEMHY